MRDIPTVRQGLKCPATRKLDDGTDYDTLPMLVDPSTNKVIGDSFDIATFLDDTFPNSGGCLFPFKPDYKWTGHDYESPASKTVFFAPITTNEGHKHAAYARFNLHVDASFSANIPGFGYNLPFNPETAEEDKARMAKRAHLPSWEILKVEGEARRPLMDNLRDGLESLAKLFQANEGGPYLEGEKANYADLIVGGWLNMFSTIMEESEWEEFKTFHGGVLGRLHDALQENYFFCK